MQSLLSEADDSSWKYATWIKCNGKLEYEQDLLYRQERVQDNGEAGNIYPCDWCGYQGPDIVALKNHTEEEHVKSYYNGRIKQNLHTINFDDDSDENVELEPNCWWWKITSWRKEPEKEYSINARNFIYLF